jgi:hypothetical protein
MNQQPFITLVDQILAAKKQHTPLSPFDRGHYIHQSSLDRKELAEELPSN